MNEHPLFITSIYKPSQARKIALPIVLSSVQAGFPSPADDHVEKQLDLNELLIQHPTSTFYVRVEGDSMRDAGIQSGDILVVDRSLTATSGRIVVAVINGEFTVKRFIRKGDAMILAAENPNYPDIHVEQGSDFQIWGVVTFVIHKAV